MDAETLNALYGTDNGDEIIKSKETDTQIKAFTPAKPKRVQMSIDKCKKLCEAAGLEYLDGYEGRVVEHKITDETVDRYGDIVRAKGLDFKTNYSKNSVIQYAHDYKQPPIGKSVRVWYDKIDNSVKSWGLYFDDRVDKTGLSDTIFKYIVAGAMPACSVGFNPIKVNNPRKAEDRQKLGLGEWGVEFIKCDLLEYSPCSIGANPNALQNSIKSGETLVTKRNIEILKEKELIPDDMFDSIMESIEKDIEPEETLDIEPLMKSLEETRESNEKTLESNKDVLEKLEDLGNKIKDLNITLEPSEETPPEGGELDNEIRGLFNDFTDTSTGEGAN